MKVTIWGSRGSVPVSGASFARHGGATTCLEVSLPGGGGEGPTRVILDCGTGLTSLGKAWGARRPEALILQTHMHWDHIQGFPFFAPLFDPRARFGLWAVPREGQTLQEVLGRQMTRPTFPVGLDIIPAALDFRALAPGGEARLGELRLRWCEACHPGGGTSWRLDHRGASLVFSGDTEVQAGRRAELVALAEGADLLIMDAQYFPEDYPARRGFGHSTSLDAVSVAREAKVKQLLLTHHDPSHEDAQLDRKLAQARQAVGGAQLMIDNAYEGMQREVGAWAGAWGGAQVLA